MARGYGEAAVAAVNLVKLERFAPPEAWRRAVARTFESVSSQEKGCPQGAFLGLCEEGLVVGVPGAPSGTYTRSVKNKQYAVAAVNILRRRASPVLPTPVTLWLEVQGGEWKQPNGQMDVVLGLWNAGHIRR
ncbi:DUF6979 family protein [Anaeromyxobacter diazotrophicus]|uniref:Uncharacterized protein n=1 Tax=Anaeromyxobacter diazotrophicus TaxID=2590199 RepID=A0A7I9VKD2_9BACT|nr:hypothetical protein [Anaeromyxobacter diazotrophicus]GEJ56610.1 hypothetical protein AMYX_13510 [Anaeromyxobacter diazotrophicus]